ncbi:hypothetical protein PC128_g10759 [Phytophthora cactorum]|nr:hypothetical protein PC128_g10759 [Phytophthora cactorum]
MSPETDSNDHVPLEFLLGARVKHYYPDISKDKHQACSSKVPQTKRIFAQSIHPRRREEQARQLLQRVLDQDDPRRIDGPSESEVDFPAESDKPSLLKALTHATTTSHAGQEVLYDEANFQLRFGNASLSPARIKTLQQLRDDDLRRQNQRVTSFHRYEQDNNRPFLGITGAAAHNPQTTTRQLRDLKATKQLKDERTQELLEILREQQKHTQTALRQHQQFAKALQRQKHPGVVSTSLLSLDSVKKCENGNGWSEITGRKTMPPLQLPEAYYEHHLPEEQEHQGRPALATLNFDARALSQLKSMASPDGTPPSVSTNNEEGYSDVDDDCEQVGKRLGDRQREVFASNAANGLFLGGGFISKTKDKKPKPRSISNSSNQLAKPELLESVLGAQSASILPHAQANKPALRRREASAGRQQPNKSS